MTTLVQQYFIESAKKFPNKPAICCEETSINFIEADNFTNAFAKEIQNTGVKRGTLIPFFIKKGVNSLLSILGTLKADCAYVPVDINSPAQRLLAILKATEAKVVIVDDASQAIIKSLLKAEQLPTLLNVEQFEALDTSPLEYKNLSIDIAYVLFTSGSTGIPKGVMIPHKAIIDYIDWCTESYQLTDQDVISNHAPLYFDNSTFDIYNAFKIGATLHLVHDELNAVLPRLVKWLNEREITTFFCVPSVLTLLLKSRRLKEDSFPKLRHIICAGEVLPTDVIREWMKQYPSIQFTNMYGPTEITVDCNYHFIQQIPSDDTLSIPIGKARRNMELFVRTESGLLTQEPGIKGELLVRGTSVAYGYLGDEEKTRKVFIQNPNNRHFHDPLYCTGDLVYINDDGDFEFLGRMDDQIKYLGYRIELGEIEASLIAIEHVQEGIVVFGKSSSDNENEIGALVSLHSDVDVNELKKQLTNKLPNYMVPTRIKLFDGDFPRTANGKYDRKSATKIVFDN